MHLPFDICNFFRVGIFFNAADPCIVHMDDPVCNGCDRRIVGDDNDSRTLLSAHVLENLQYLFAGVIVQCAGGFVTEQDLRVFGNGSGNGNTLLLTAGELCRKVVDAVGKPYVFQNRDRIQGVFHDFRGKLYVFLCRQILHQIVELEHKSHIGAAVCGQLCAAVFGDVLAVDDDLAAVVGVHAAEDVQHRGFSGAGRAYDSIGRDELKRFLNHDFQSIVMSIVEQIERKKNVHSDPDAKKIICNFYTEGMAGELVDLLKSRDAAQDEKSIRCISLVVRTSLEAAVISCSKMQ